MKGSATLIARDLRNYITYTTLGNLPGRIHFAKKQGEEEYYER